MRIGRQGGDRAADVSRRLGECEFAASRKTLALFSIYCVAPVRLGDTEVVEHHLRAKPSWRDRDRRCSVRFELMALSERQPIDGHFARS
jgi:hypothetical protein